MSWVKRRGHTTPSPGTAGTAPPVPMYDPNQHSGQTVSVGFLLEIEGIFKANYWLYVLI